MRREQTSIEREDLPERTASWLCLSTPAPYGPLPPHPLAPSRPGAPAQDGPFVDSRSQGRAARPSADGRTQVDAEHRHRHRQRRDEAAESTKPQARWLPPSACRRPRSATTPPRCARAWSLPRPGCTPTARPACRSRRAPPAGAPALPDERARPHARRHAPSRPQAMNAPGSAARPPGAPDTTMAPDARQRPVGISR